jgi:selenide,water dikinase
VPGDGGLHPARILTRVGDERRLTSFSHGAGCGCKLGPSDLQTLLGTLSLPEVTEEVLVAADTGDDAAVVRLPDGHALVATLDFFTPIVDDPYDWGRIAAANALSDVYAMGGRPFLALNIVSWPVDDLPLEMLGRVLQGGIDVASKAGAAVLGGHSITDPEPKFGMVALGLADPDRIVRNSTARPGARLFLTKPLGLGVVSTAVKRGVAEDALVATAVELMTTLNADASEAMLEAGAGAATDVTGFGLLGHLHRMLLASEAAAELDAGAVPVLEGVLDLARSDVVPGGSKRNHAYVSPATDWGELTPPEQLVLADAQTSGGLLIAAEDGDRVAGELRSRAVAFAEIGRVQEGRPGYVRVDGRLVSGSGE